jgi:hypothetical protein
MLSLFFYRKRCRLAAPVRDHSSKLRFREKAEVVREVNNLGRRMLRVLFDDGSSVSLSARGNSRCGGRVRTRVASINADR